MIKTFIKIVKYIFLSITTLIVLWVIMLKLYTYITSEVYECQNLITNYWGIYRREEFSGSSYVYREAKYIKMPRVHLWNFECIDGVYGKANNTIYYLGVPMPSFDYATFETIKWSSFAKDKNYVYCFWHVVDWADSKTFTSTKNTEEGMKGILGAFISTGRDKNRSYTCEYKF